MKDEEPVELKFEIQSPVHNQLYVMKRKCTNMRKTLESMKQAAPSIGETPAGHESEDDNKTNKSSMLKTDSDFDTNEPI